MIIVLTPESPIIRSIFARCELDAGHFMWTGGTSKGGGKKDQPGHGYPSVWVPELKRSVRGHRLIFAAFYGTWELPLGYHREHVCNRSLCLNPACMELVTAEENQRRKIWRDQAVREGRTEMICPECKDAADLVTRTRTAATEEIGIVGSLTARSVETITGWLAQARSDHGKCRGTTWCDCHHQVPEIRALAA